MVSDFFFGRSILEFPVRSLGNSEVKLFKYYDLIELFINFKWKLLKYILLLALKFLIFASGNPQRKFLML